MVVLAAVLVVTYGTGVRAYRRAAGRAWSTGRMVGFVAGCGTMAAAGVLPDGSYAGHMVEHVLLGMASPMLLALGAPLTLLLQTAPDGTRAIVRRALRWRVLHVVGHPIVGWVLFGGSLVVLVFTPIFDLAVRNAPVHLLVHLHVLLVGCVFVWPLLAVDPVPRPIPEGGRLLSALAAVPFHAFVAVALLSSSTVVNPAAYPSLADQRRGAAILWASGELFTVVLAGLIFARWYRSDRRAAARIDRRAASI